MNDSNGSSYLQKSISNSADSFTIDNSNKVTFNCLEREWKSKTQDPTLQQEECCAEKGQYIYWKETWDRNKKCTEPYKYNNPLPCCDKSTPIYGLNGAMRCPEQ